MTDKFPLIFSKVERAKKHIEDLHLALEALWDAEPNSIRFEDDLNTGERSYYLVRVGNVPLEISVIIGDALHNLRSALDHLAHQFPRAPGVVPGWTQFPIVDDAAKYMSSDVRGKVQLFRQDVVKALDALKPYKGGDRDDTLWKLHRLNTIDKHRLLLTACIASDARSMTPTERQTIIKVYSGSYHGHPLPDLRGTLKGVIPVPLKAGDKLWTVHKSELEQNVHFHFDVAFDEPTIIKCESVVAALHKMAKLVGKIILDFDPLLV